MRWTLSENIVRLKLYTSLCVLKEKIGREYNLDKKKMRLWWILLLGFLLVSGTVKGGRIPREEDKDDDKDDDKNGNGNGSGDDKGIDTFNTKTTTKHRKKEPDHSILVALPLSFSKVLYKTDLFFNPPGRYSII
ncbi:hypothetical protein C0J52_16052, partial [Blattella germanica]